VGAGEMYYPDASSGPWVGFDWVDAPPGAKDVHAVQVRGGSMAPVYRDGDLLFFRRVDGTAPSDCVGMDCIVQIRGGAAYVKLLERMDQRYRLTSYNPDVAPILDPDIEWLAPIEWRKQGRRR
jgi:phage repressor protein C with HTH and peptisase S24 domain